MSKKGAYVSSNPVERLQAELQELEDELKGATNGSTGQDDTGGANTNQEPPEPIADIEDPGEDPPSDQHAAQHDDYKQKWESLQGIIRSKDAQINALTLQVQQLTQQIQELMATIQQAPQQSAGNSNNADTSASNLAQIADSISEQFGDELGAVFKKFAEHIHKLEERGKTVSQELGEVRTNLSQGKAEERLTSLCPTWRQIDSDQAFITWLSRLAPYSNKTLHAVMNENWQAGNVETVAAIFNEYIAEKAQQNAPPQDPRAALVTPGRRGVSSPPASNGQQEKPIYTEAQVDKFFKDVQTGKYKGREAEAKRIEDAISIAYLEGRVR